MPPTEKKSAATTGSEQAPIRRPNPKRSASSGRRPDDTPVPSLLFTPTDEHTLLVAIRQFPNELTTHLVYADWLSEYRQESRAAVLRAWVEVVRLPYSAANGAAVLRALQGYWNSLLEEDARWLEAMERLRPWIPIPLAEKIVRVCIEDVYGPMEAETWEVEVTRCYFDERWHGAYKGLTLLKGRTRNRSGAFFINPISGRPSGHVTTG